MQSPHRFSKEKFCGLLASECYTGQTPFLSPNQQCQSTEGHNTYYKL